jgi:hypothetical protein
MFDALFKVGTQNRDVSHTYMIVILILEEVCASGLLYMN